MYTSYYWNIEMRLKFWLTKKVLIGRLILHLIFLLAVENQEPQLQRKMEDSMDWQSWYVSFFLKIFMWSLVIFFEIFFLWFVDR